MSSKVHVSAETLESLKAVLQRFASEAQESLEAVSREIQHTENWLDEHKHYRKQKMVRCERMRDEARAVLDECRERSRREADCSRLEQHYAAAERAFQQASEELGKLRKIENQVKGVVAEYQRQARHLSDFLKHTIPEASEKLERKISDLHGYTSISLTTYSPSISNTHTSSIQPSSSIVRTYGAYGYQNIPLDQIDLGDSPVHDVSDFKKVSYDQIKEGIRKLHETVRPAVEQGVDPEFFSQLDQQKELGYLDGYRNIYDAYYGNQRPIKLIKSGNRYMVENGYHRLFVAQAMGLQSIPAKIIKMNS